MTGRTFLSFVVVLRYPNSWGCRNIRDIGGMRVPRQRERPGDKLTHGFTGGLTTRTRPQQRNARTRIECGG